MKRLLIATLGVALAAPSAFATCDLGRVVGYTLVAQKTVVAKIQDGKREDGFSGCTFGRILVFDDNTGARCTEYNYEYAYRPDAFIFVRGSSIKACIESTWYEMAPL